MDQIPINNLFEDVPNQLPSELFQEITHGKRFRLERIVSDGNHTTRDQWLDQPETEWVALLNGAARIEFEESDVEIELKPGDYLTIPAHARHRVLWTSEIEKTVWLAIHFDRS